MHNDKRRKMFGGSLRFSMSAKSGQGPSAHRQRRDTNGRYYGQTNGRRSLARGRQSPSIDHGCIRDLSMFLSKYSCTDSVLTCGYSTLTLLSTVNCVYRCTLTTIAHRYSLFLHNRGTRAEERTGRRQTPLLPWYYLLPT